MGSAHSTFSSIEPQEKSSTRSMRNTGILRYDPSDTATSTQGYRTTHSKPHLKSSYVKMYADSMVYLLEREKLSQKMSKPILLSPRISVERQRLDSVTDTIDTVDSDTSGKLLISAPKDNLSRVTAPRTVDSDRKERILTVRCLELPFEFCSEERIKGNNGTSRPIMLPEKKKQEEEAERNPSPCSKSVVRNDTSGKLLISTTKDNLSRVAAPRTVDSDRKERILSVRRLERPFEFCREERITGNNSTSRPIMLPEKKKQEEEDERNPSPCSKSVVRNDTSGKLLISTTKDNLSRVTAPCPLLSLLLVEESDFAVEVLVRRPYELSESSNSETSTVLEGETSSIPVFSAMRTNTDRSTIVSHEEEEILIQERIKTQMQKLCSDPLISTKKSCNKYMNAIAKLVKKENAGTQEMMLSNMIRTKHNEGFTKSASSQEGTSDQLPMVVELWQDVCSTRTKQTADRREPAQRSHLGSRKSLKTSDSSKTASVRFNRLCEISSEKQRLGKELRQRIVRESASRVPPVPSRLSKTQRLVKAKCTSPKKLPRASGDAAGTPTTPRRRTLYELSEVSKRKQEEGKQRRQQIQKTIAKARPSPPPVGMNHLQVYQRSLARFPAAERVCRTERE